MVKDNCCDLGWLLISTVGRSPFLTYVSIVNDFDKVFISTFLCRWEWSWQIQSSAQVAVGSGSDFLFVFIGLVVKGSMSRGFTLILFHSILFIWTPDWHAVVYSNMGFDFGEIFVSYVRIFTPRCHWKRVVIMCFWVWSIKNRVKTFMTSLVSKGKTFKKIAAIFSTPQCQWHSGYFCTCKYLREIKTIWKSISGLWDLKKQVSNISWN